ncbi:Pre-rRNA-processing protein PNO1 domain protein [Candida parapsilosis]|uniref:Pre-rRNA-processing protein PNO1 n=2 Tax=Candida parapsilosis TaxID=5480 RepID=G8BEL1_CANPC|nr:uncharacterized protein CPAR2_200430 [Candida parapsilosis]KAF6055446.1 Pre-rRNA-processing protein PNO1 domain protein [Candida parapsilosis]KAF6055531.1 Pre-rRNA-processing protein PNO1 domain protein [Candida parapsilosis]KAF6058461.1 Pre-rRNA-processing protein PNO1 domain protein [Candida parapsilosis]KAF6067218.1 Pre-rRNA-processing protein PNO1 domain protein [Candida parapsilosis]KAI5903848.1 Pre-rRNA-processing protein PNO1 [Candida parapsilosis]
MSAPTALKRVEEPQNVQEVHDVPPQGNEVENDDEMLIDTENVPSHELQQQGKADAQTVELDESGKPKFSGEAQSNMKVKLESRKVPVPPHRMTPLKNVWTKVYPPLVDHLKLQVRMNLKTKTVELKTNKSTTDPGALQKGADFVKAFTLGFDVDDAIALLRLDDLYIETFEIKDVKTLTGDHLSRAIGRIAGKDGKTKFAIENATRTRIVLADSKIHILGGFTHIRMAREAVVSLILGSPPGKVYGNLRTVASRMKERY